MEETLFFHSTLNSHLSTAPLHLYDAHQHFHFDQLTPHRAEITHDLAGVGVKGAVVNGTNEEEWPVVAALAKEYAWIVPSFGVHPWDCGNRSPEWEKKLRAALRDTPGAGVGEIGLDRWLLELKPDDPRVAGLRPAPLEEQTAVFAAQLALAAEFDRAPSIHCVQAWGALYDTLKKARLPARGFLIHGYAGPAEMIRNFTDLGAHYSFNIQLLEPRHKSRLENFRHVPVKRLLVETDAPTKPPAGALNRFPLPPAADGSQVNHPANIVVAYEQLAQLRHVPLQTLAPQIEHNFKRLFR
jgi:TatD DNase family protein